MSKMAIFVEGQTELIFMERLVESIAGKHNVHIDTIVGFGGTKVPRQWIQINATGPQPHQKYHVVIYSSENYGRVVSDIRDRYTDLISQGFSYIIGMRDVHPQPAADIPTIRSDFAMFVPSNPVVPQQILQVMEIEAWFIAEYFHYPHIHPNLTHSVATAHFSFDPSTYDVQLIPSPCDTLRSFYMLEHKGYNKSRKHRERTVDVLDYAHLYLGVAPRIPDFANLVRTIDTFLT